MEILIQQWHSSALSTPFGGQRTIQNNWSNPGANSKATGPGKYLLSLLPEHQRRDQSTPSPAQQQEAASARVPRQWAVLCFGSFRKTGESFTWLPLRRRIRFAGISSRPGCHGLGSPRFNLFFDPGTQ